MTVLGASATPTVSASKQHVGSGSSVGVKNDTRENMAEQHDASVLFVHGIGWQRPGQTLDSFVNPLRTILQQLAVDATTEMRVSWTEIYKSESVPQRIGARVLAWLWEEIRFWRRPSRGLPPDEPQYTQCEIHMSPTDSNGPRQKWLLAESCWARSFPNPTGRELAGWAIKIAPLFALLYTAAAEAPAVLLWISRFRHKSQLSTVDYVKLLPGVLAIYARFAVNVVAVTLVSAVVIPAIVLTSFLPFFRWIGLAAIGLFGDSYAAVVRQASLDNMVNKIEQDISWCLERSPRLVIVAHSQGAMLAREALARMNLGDRVTLVGLGSGVALLQSLHATERMKVFRFGWLGLLSVCACICVFLWVAVSGFLHMFQSIFPNLWSMVAMLVAGTLMILCLKLLGFQSLPSRLQQLTRYDRKNLGRWIEFASWHDPVTFGPLLKVARTSARKSQAAPTVEVRMVSNGTFLPLEHVGYRRNPVVLSCILREINDSSKTPITALSDSIEKVRASALPVQRAYRAKLHTQSQTLQIVAALLLAATVWIVWL